MSCSHSPNSENSYSDQYGEIPAKLDSLVIEVRDSYGVKCVKPILEQDFGASNCSNRLFQLIERRYGLKFTEGDLTRAAMELFEPVLKKQVRDMLQGEPYLKSVVMKEFKNPSNLMATIKSRYLSGKDPFHKDLEFKPYQPNS